MTEGVRMLRSRLVRTSMAVAAVVVMAAVLAGCKVERATVVDAGPRHSCAVVESGAVKCWGHNAGYGQLGDGTFVNHSAAVDVVGLSSAVGVSGALSHSCAVLADGSAACWGRNNSGQLGDGTTDSSPTPVTVAGLDDATKVVVGMSHSCALIADGTVRCWGDGSNGELGDGLLTDSATPVAVSGLTDVVDLTGSLLRTCAVRSDGSVACWGLRLPPTFSPPLPPWNPTPVKVSSVSDVRQVAVGDRHACAVISDGTVRCWGENLGQLGNGSTVGNGPVVVTGLTDVVEVAVGDYHTCARRDDGTVTCWGRNFAGQLGDGTTTDHLPGPGVTVTDLGDATALSTGGNVNCVVRATTRVACWGENERGQAGGTTDPQLVPREVRLEIP